MADRTRYVSIPEGEEDGDFVSDTLVQEDVSPQAQELYSPLNMQRAVSDDLTAPMLGRRESRTHEERLQDTNARTDAHHVARGSRNNSRASRGSLYRTQSDKEDGADGGSTASETPPLLHSRTTLLLFPDANVGEVAVPEADSDDEDRNFWDNASMFLLNFRIVRSLRAPLGYYRRRWNFLVFVFIMYNAVSIPLRFAFQSIWKDEVSIALMHVADYLGDVVFIFDIVLQFFTPYNDENGFFVTDPVKIRHKYLRTYFPLDFIASLPLGFFSFTVWKHVLLRSPRLLRLVKYNEYFSMWEHHAIGPAHVKIRFAKLFLGLLLVVHWLGCVYVAIAYMRGFPEEEPPWLPNPKEIDFENVPISAQYLYAFFWAANMVMGVGGEPEPPSTDTERIIALLIAIISIFIVAIIIGNVADLISHISHEEEVFRRKMHTLNKFMHSRQLPNSLRKRIREYFVNVIQHRAVSNDDSGLLDELPVALRIEATKYMNEDIITKADLFQYSSQGFVNALVGYLKSQIYFPGDCIVKEGDIGSEMFFILRGSVRVIVNKEQVATLNEGGFFGEIALLEEYSKRTATILAKEYCELVVLLKEDLESVFKSFPLEKQIIIEIADIRKGKDLIRKQLTEETTLADTSPEFLKALADSFISHAVDPDKEVFHEYDQADTLYFLSKGQVSLYKGKSQRGTVFGHIISAAAQRANLSTPQSATVSRKTSKIEVVDADLEETKENGADKRKDTLPGKLTVNIPDHSLPPPHSESDEKLLSPNSSGSRSADSPGSGRLRHSQTEQAYPRIGHGGLPRARSVEVNINADGHGHQHIAVSPSTSARPSRANSSALLEHTDPHETPLSVLKPPAFFGGVYDKRYAHTAITSGEMLSGSIILFSLSKDAVDRILEEWPDQAEKFQTFMSKHRGWNAIARNKFLGLVKRKKKTKFPFISKAMSKFLRNHPTTSRQSFRIGSGWLQRLGQMQTAKWLHSELELLSPAEVTVAIELLQELQEMVTKELFTRASVE